MPETRSQFHEAMEGLRLEILEEGELAERAVARGVRAIADDDPELAEAVIGEDDAVDEHYLDIDRRVLELIAIQSPVASDLRFLSAILHINLHLERIGDQGVNIAKIHLATQELPKTTALRAQIDEMGTLAVAMVRTSIRAFAEKDLELCLTLPKLDDPVDRLNRLTHLEALKLADDPRALEWGLHMNLVARALERVGDNAVDIGEQVAFFLTGEFREFTDASHGVELEGGR
jgi:phosphate transport system protein